MRGLPSDSFLEQAGALLLVGHMAQGDALGGSRCGAGAAARRLAGVESVPWWLRWPSGSRGGFRAMRKMSRTAAQIRADQELLRRARECDS